MNPLVSILIPCYNAERWIAHTIESALAQTWPEKEVIVIDDGSTDGSVAVIQGYSERIRWETGPNRGANAARNRMLELAKGDWIQYLDADDYLTPEKVARQIDFLKPHSDADILYSPFIMEHWRNDVSRLEETRVQDPCDIWVLLSRWFLPGTGSGIWRKQALLDVGGWDEKQPCCQEHELYFRLLQKGARFQYCPHTGYVYRQWSENTVCKKDKSEVYRRRMAILQRIEDHLLRNDELTGERLWAINQGRFETARSAWLKNPQFGQDIIRRIKSSQPGFMPSGDSAPRPYQIIYRMFGFHAAESIGSLKRRFAGNGNSSGA